MKSLTFIWDESIHQYGFTGWMHMGRTIALKLSKNEELIVAQLNKQGFRNSELLRNALRQYFEFLHQTTALARGKSLAGDQGDASIVFQDSLMNLMNDVEEIRCSLRKTQEEMQIEQARVLQTLSEICVDTTMLKKQPASEPAMVVRDVHSEIDAFLEQRSHDGVSRKRL